MSGSNKQVEHPTFHIVGGSIPRQGPLVRGLTFAVNMSGSNKQVEHPTFHIVGGSIPRQGPLVRGLTFAVNMSGSNKQVEHPTFHIVGGSIPRQGPLVRGLTFAVNMSGSNKQVEHPTFHIVGGSIPRQGPLVRGLTFAVNMSGSNKQVEHPTFHTGGKIRSGPQSGQIGYLTPAVSGSPTAAERGAKSEVAHKVGKLATSPLPYRGAPPLQSGGLNQKWPTKWARWLHNLFCAFQPFLNSPQNSEYFEDRHIGWNKKNSPCRMPKTKSPAPPAPTKHLVPCDNFGVRRGGGGPPPPPLWGRVLT